MAGAAVVGLVVKTAAVVVAAGSVVAVDDLLAVEVAVESTATHSFLVTIIAGLANVQTTASPRPVESAVVDSPLPEL